MWSAATRRRFPGADPSARPRACPQNHVRGASPPGKRHGAAGSSASSSPGGAGPAGESGDQSPHSKGPGAAALAEAGGAPMLRDAVTTKLLLILCALAVAATTSRSAEAPPPNIVLILADDLGINDLGCSGRKDQTTPNLDRLAVQGMRFTNAYAAAPLCSASRAALLTGKHPARLQLTSYLPGRADSRSQKLLQPRQEGQIPLEEITMAEALQQAGYATACLGKWHLGGAGFGPEAQGFQTVQPGQPRSEPTATEGSKGEMGLAAQAEQFIAAHRDQPFFLYLPHDSPHIPFAATDEGKQKFRDAFNPTYAAVIESLDASVGRVLAALDAHDLSSRTIVVFTSDNGGLHVPELGHDPPTHNTPYRAGKGFLLDGGIRVPLIVRWLGTAAAGSTQTQPVVLTDLMPTLMAAAGLDPAKASGPLDGFSLLPILRSAPPPAQARELYWHFPHYSNQGGRPSGALREGRWKIIEDFESGTTALYDLDTDPGESTDLAAAQPEVAAAMTKHLTDWRQRVGARRPRANPEFAAYADDRPALATDISRPPAPTTAAALTPAWAAWRAAMDAAVAGRNPSVTPARGDIRLQARDARVHATKMRYEPEPWKNTLGYWVDPADWAEWDFTLPADGRYEIEVLQGCGTGNGGSEVSVSLGEQTLTFTVQETGHFQHFIPIVIGELDLKAGTHTLAIRPVKKARDAVMDVRRVVVRPAP